MSVFSGLADVYVCNDCKVQVCSICLPRGWEERKRPKGEGRVDFDTVHSCAACTGWVEEVISEDSDVGPSDPVAGDVPAGNQDGPGKEG